MKDSFEQIPSIIDVPAFAQHWVEQTFTSAEQKEEFAAKFAKHGHSLGSDFFAPYDLEAFCADANNVKPYLLRDEAFDSHDLRGNIELCVYDFLTTK